MEKLKGHEESDSEGESSDESNLSQLDERD